MGGTNRHVRTAIESEPSQDPGVHPAGAWQSNATPLLLVVVVVGIVFMLLGRSGA
jgi:hypothetical protein